MFGIILDGLTFLLSKIGPILSLVGIATVGDWVVHKYTNSTSSSSSSGSTSKSPTILGTANFIGWVVILAGGLAVVRQYLVDKGEGKL